MVASAHERLTSTVGGLGRELQGDGCSQIIRNNGGGEIVKVVKNKLFIR